MRAYALISEKGKVRASFHNDPTAASRFAKTGPFERVTYWRPLIFTQRSALSEFLKTRPPDEPYTIKPVTIS